MLQIIRVIRHMLRERRWWHLPRYTFGSSSGGVIALELPLRFPFQACTASPVVGVAHVIYETLCGRISCAACFPGARSSKAAWYRIRGSRKLDFLWQHGHVLQHYPGAQTRKIRFTPAMLL